MTYNFAKLFVLHGDMFRFFTFWDALTLLLEYNYQFIDMK